MGKLLDLLNKNNATNCCLQSKRMYTLKKNAVDFTSGGKVKIIRTGCKLCTTRHNRILFSSIVLHYTSILRKLEVIINFINDYHEVRPWGRNLGSGMFPS